MGNVLPPLERDVASPHRTRVAPEPDFCVRPREDDLVGGAQLRVLLGEGVGLAPAGQKAGDVADISLMQ